MRHDKTNTCKFKFSKLGKGLQVGQSKVINKFHIIR